MNSKKNLFVYIGLLIITFLVFLSLALKSEVFAQRPEGEAKKIFCSKIYNVFSTIKTRVLEREEKIKERHQEIVERIRKNQERRRKRLEEIRKKRWQNFENRINKLLERVKDEKKREAILAFKEAVKNAIQKRQTAFKNAIETFRNEIKRIREERREKILSAVSAYRQAIISAFEKAISDCENGVDPVTVRENLRNDIKTAREEFVSQMQNLEKFRDEIRAAITAKREAFKKAIEEFRKEVKEAVEALKAALKEE